MSDAVKRVIAFAAIAMLLIKPVFATDASTPLTAIWRVQQLELLHSDDSAFYSCPHLVDRIADILKALGAQVANEAQTRCVRLAPGMQSIVITFMHPVEATPENLREAGTATAVQQLRARVRGETLPKLEELERFEAAWRTVALHRVPGLRINQSDCGILRMIHRQAFPQLAIEPETAEPFCSHTPTPIRPRVVARALVPLA